MLIFRVSNGENMTGEHDVLLSVTWDCRPIKYIYIAKIINIKWTNCTNLPMLVCNPNYIRCCSVDSNATDVR